MIIKTGRYTIKFAKLPTLICLCLLALLLSLGSWQMNRAEQKREFLQQQQRAEVSDSLSLSSVMQDSELTRYQKLTVTGHYDKTQQFLIDNQINEGKVGYFVLTPFMLQGEQKAMLVNRGWIAANPNRTQLPDVTIPVETITTITGRANYFPSVGIKIAGAEIPTDSTPSVVQVVDSAVLAKKLGYPLFGMQLELDTSQPHGFKRDWHTTTLMPPEQHIVYALQWFALAATLTILFIVFSVKKTS
jgi:surfeit locus 1 family protein